MRKCLWAVLGAVVGIGCGVGAGSCDETSTLGHCTTYLGSNYDSKSVQAACTGTYSTGACAATAGGSCTLTPLAGNELRYSFPTADAGATLGTVQTYCASVNGTYSAN